MNGTTPPVIFSYETWVAMFSEFSPLSAAQGQGYFNNATLICGNSTSNPIFCDGNLAALLYWLTSHFAWLNCPKDSNGNPAATGAIASQLVGRISDASEGSVSVSTEWRGDTSDVESFLSQSRYGITYWTMTAQYRTGRYLARPTFAVQPWGYNGFGRGYGWGGWRGW